MRIHYRRAALVLLCLTIVAPILARADQAAAATWQPATYQIAEPSQEAAQAPQPPEGAAYTEIAPDGTCASGFTAFVVAHGVRECYTPDPVVENENLQNTCPTDPSLFICPGQAD
jgi:hypothetical protein